MQLGMEKALRLQWEALLQVASWKGCKSERVAVILQLYIFSWGNSILYSVTFSLDQASFWFVFSSEAGVQGKLESSSLPRAYSKNYSNKNSMDQ